LSESDGFALTKWYLDCVDPAGRAAVAYWAALSWRGLSLLWQNVTRYDPGRTPVEHSSLARVGPPVRDGEMLTWHSEPLGCSVELRPRRPALEVRLLGDDRGAVDWRCETGGTDATFQVGGERLTGRGYAERLVLTLPPWRIPIRELRWGRWIARDADRSVVWIDWRGSHPATWVLVDGALVPEATVSDAAVRAGDLALDLTEPRTLHERSLDRVVNAIAPLQGLLPASLLALRECKWLSAGECRSAAAAPLAGWAIHELVVFP
jgi:hypothetical protein